MMKKNTYNIRENLKMLKKQVRNFAKKYEFLSI